MKERLYLIVYQKPNGEWEYKLDSQGRPTMYRDFNQLKKYAYKFKNTNCRIVEYQLNSTAIPFSEIELLYVEE